MVPQDLAVWARRGGAFLAVGGAAFVIDAVSFNLLAYGFSGRGPLYELPLVAKTTAILLATLFTYIGNRHWTFASRKTATTPRQLIVFSSINVVAMGIQLGCLAFSRYVLQLEGPIPDNISGTLVGQALATAFRFVTYDKWVFPENPKNGPTLP